MRRPTIAALAGAVLLLACMAGCLGDDPAATSPRSGNPLSTFNTSEARPEATFSTNLSLEVVYSGMWSGAYGSPEAMHSDDGFGNRTFPLPSRAKQIQATFQKQESTDEPLVLRLVQDGRVLKETSGAGPLAKVTLVATPAST